MLDRTIIMPSALEDPSHRGYSPGVKVGNLLFLAGQTGSDVQPEPGQSVIEAHTRRAFERIAIILAEAGGTLADLVTMTVFITDIRYGNEFVALRAEILGKDFPGSALIGVSHLAAPHAVVEIQAIAVLDE